MKLPPKHGMKQIAFKALLFKSTCFRLKAASDDSQEISTVTDPKAASRQFPIPKEIGRFTEATYGTDDRYKSTGMNIYISDGYKEISITQAKMKSLHQEILIIEGTKKKASTCVLNDKYRIPSNTNQNKFVTKFVKVALEKENKKENKESTDNEGGGRILVVQSMFRLSDMDKNQFTELSSYGIKLSLKEFKDVFSKIHQGGRRITVQDSDPEDTMF